MGHQKRIKAFAGCFLWCECFEFSDKNHLRGKKALLNYYKLGHHLGFSFHIITVTLVKLVLFNPFWTPLTASLEDLKQMDDATNLRRGLLRSKAEHSGASSRKKRPSRNGRVQLKDVAVNEPGASFQVEYIQPDGEGEPPNPTNPYIRPSEGSEDFPPPAYSGPSRNYVSRNNDHSISMNSDMSHDEPWG